MSTLSGPSDTIHTFTPIKEVAPLGDEVLGYIASNDVVPAVICQGKRTNPHIVIATAVLSRAPFLSFVHPAFQSLPELYTVRCRTEEANSRQFSCILNFNGGGYEDTAALDCQSGGGTDLPYLETWRWIRVGESCPCAEGSGGHY